jgi:two-component system, chemotaxis family, chemotaxis protein CheY
MFQASKYMKQVSKPGAGFLRLLLSSVEDTRGLELKRRVLIVDDIPDIRLMLRYLIENENYVIVAEAANGVEAVEQFCEHLPDITIMDIDMPFKTGVEAAREILEHTGDARIIFCSGGSRYPDLSSLGLNFHPRSLVRKPFLPDQLYQAMSM